MKNIDASISLKDMFTPAMQSIVRSIQEAERMEQSFNATTNGMAGALGHANQNISEHSKLHKRIAQDIQKTGKSISSIGDSMMTFTGALITAAGAGLTLQSQFTNGMAKVSTLIDTNVVSLQQLSDGVRKVSDETGASVTELAEAEYQALSAGVDAANVTDFLRTATLAAKAGFTDTTTAIDGLTTVINAYGMSADQAAALTDKMLMTQNLGKTTFGELAQGIGSVATAAALAKVSTDDLFASMAILTKNGVHTAEAFTGFQGILSAVSKQSQQSIKTATELGINFTPEHLGAVGWQKFLEEIKEKVGDDQTAIQHLFGRVEAANAFKVLTKNMDEYNKTADTMKNSSGATEEAFYKMMTPAEQNKIAMNQLRNAAMDLARGLTPLMRSAAIVTKNFASWLNGLSPAQKAFLENIGKIVVAFGVLTPVLGRGVTMFGKFYSIVFGAADAIAANGGAIAALGAKFARTIALGKALGGQFRSLGSAARQGVAAAGRVVAEGPVHRVLTQIGVMIEGPFIAAFRGGRNAVVAFGNALRNPAAALSSLRAAVGRLASGLTGMIGRAVSTVGSMIPRAMGAAVSAVKGALNGIGNAFSRIPGLLQNPLRAFQLLRTGALNVFRAIATGMRATLLSPMGIAVAVIVGLAYLIYKNWDSVKAKLTQIFGVMKKLVGDAMARIAEKLGPLVVNFQRVFGKTVGVVQSAWTRISALFSGGGGKISAVMAVIGNVIGAGFVAAFGVVVSVVETAINIVIAVVNGVITVFGGIIDFISGVFAGDWAAAWQGIVEIFSGIFSGISGIADAIIGGIRGAINALIDGVNSISVDIPDWVPGVGGSHFSPNLPYLAHGTENWQGGMAVIHDAGPEIVDLPRGTRVIPHDRSMAEEYERGRRAGVTAFATMTRPHATRTVSLTTNVHNHGSNVMRTNQTEATTASPKVSVVIPKLADSIIVREDADIQKIAETLAERLERRAGNMMRGALA